MRHSRGVADTLTAATRQNDLETNRFRCSCGRRFGINDYERNPKCPDCGNEGLDIVDVLDLGWQPSKRDKQGAWPTPAASTGEGGPHGLDGGAGARAMLAAAGGLNWPTPSATNPNDGQDPAAYESRRRRLQEAHGNGNGAGLVLAQAVLRPAWPTATAGDAVGAGNRNLPGSKAHPGVSLTDAVNGGQAPRRWTTPQAQDAKQASDNGIAPSSRDRDLLGAEVQRWPTAGANDHKGSSKPGQRRRQLDEAAEQKHAAGETGALNPEWVECLMGWPRGWTALDPLPQPVTFSHWPAPPGPQHPWEPPRLAPRVPGRTARLRMLGNGQVPATAVLAWRLLSEAA